MYDLILVWLFGHHFDPVDYQIRSPIVEPEREQKPQSRLVTDRQEKEPSILSRFKAERCQSASPVTESGYHSN